MCSTAVSFGLAVLRSPGTSPRCPYNTQSCPKPPQAARACRLEPGRAARTSAILPGGITRAGRVYA
jgi:hypothetical protein